MRFLKKMFVVIGSGLLLFFILLWFVYMILFPKEKIIAFVEDKIHQSTGAKADIQHIGYRAGQGLYARDIRIVKDIDSQQAAELTIKKISISLSLTDLLKREIRLTSILFNNIRGSWKQGGQEQGTLSGDSLSLQLDDTIPIRSASQTSLTDLLKSMDCKNFSAHFPTHAIHITRIETQALWIDNAIHIAPIHFSMNDEDYSGKITISSHHPFQLFGHLRSHRNSIQGSASYDHKRIQIPSLNIQHGKLLCKISGSADLKSTSKADYDIYITAPFLLEDLVDQYPTSAISDAIQGLQIKGHAKLTAHIRSQKALPMMITGKVTSKDLIVRNEILSDFESTFRVHDGILETTSFKTKLFDGMMDAYIKADIRQEEYPFQARGVFYDLTLDRVLRFFSDKKKDTRGRLDLACELEGKLADIKNIEGFGSIQLRDSDLWALPLLEIIPIHIPQRDTAKIFSGDSAFFIRKQKIITDDTVLSNSSMEVHIKGSIDFDSNLDLIVDINSLERLIHKAGDPIPAFKTIFNAVKKVIPNITSICIKGTLEAPKPQLCF